MISVLVARQEGELEDRRRKGGGGGIFSLSHGKVLMCLIFFFCSAPMPIQESQINPFDVGQPPGHTALRRHGFLIQKIAGLKKDAERSLFACLYWIPTYMHHGMVNLALTSNSGI